MKKGWERKKLKEIAEYTIGLTYSPSDVSEGGMIVLRSSNIQNGKIDLTDLVRVKKTVKPKLIVKTGDILMCSRNGSARLVGKTAVIPHLDEEMTFGTFMTVIRSPYNPFLSYFFLSDEFRKQITGGENPSIKQVTQYMLDDVEVNLPSVEEQQRIVALLDETFAALNTVHANAERNQLNSREVFEAVLDQTFADGKEWRAKKLIEVTTKIGSGATPLGGEKSYKKEGTSLIRSLNVHDLGFKYKDLAFLDIEQANKLSNVIVESGDVLLNITGASVARCCIVPDDVLPARVNQHVSIIRLLKEILLPEFSHYQLISKGYKDRLLKTGEKGGSTRQALTKAQIEELTVSFPSLTEQAAIVKKLDALLEETKKLEEVYQCKVDAVEELRKSILQKAFEGGL